MFFEHYQPSDSAKLYAEAIETDPNYAPAYLGLAKVFAKRFDKRAVDMARQALEHDPKMTAAHELLAYLALEDDDPKAAADEAQKALALSNEALDAMAVMASMDWLKDDKQSPWMDRILQVNPVYGEAYETGAHFLELNYRYEDAIGYYRKALALNENLLEARSNLGVDLMRTGQEAEAEKQLEICYAAHYRNDETVNSLRLLDTLKDYQVFKTPTTELLLNKKEAALLRPYLEPELQRIVAVYEKKYKFKLPGPVRVEVYPNHDDFAVRTLGMPGIGGLLGVTFGLVVTMDSPSARPPGEFNWGSTMWHELSHAYVLTLTHHQVPRWFTEGLAVHEEGAAAPDWGNRLTPEIIEALKKKQLLPVVQLDRGFVRPEFPSQVIVSYYQAGKICDFIDSKWGDDMILQFIHSYAARKTTAEVITENLHETPEAFDKEFAAWLDKETGSSVKNFDKWKSGLETAHADLKNGKMGDAIRTALSVQDFYPDYVGEGSAYEVLTKAYGAENKNSEVPAELRHYRDRGGSNLELLLTLARSQEKQGQRKDAELTLSKLNYIYPENEEIHRLLSKLALEDGNTAIAVRESEALLALQAGDPADTHYQLARALQAAHRPNEAKEQVILALEAAPDFKPAQQLLLQLSQ
jgi:tetratricopeptide (TPR) repeat protein